MDNKAAAVTVQRLISICKDGVEGYSLASEETRAVALKALLNSYVEQRLQFSLELQTEFQQLKGESPAIQLLDEDGSIAGVVHRTWMSIKSSVTHRDDAAILAECETGESAAVNAYEAALRADDLSSRARSVVERQYSIIVSGRNSMHVLHDAKHAKENK